MTSGCYRSRILLAAVAISMAAESCVETTTSSSSSSNFDDDDEQEDEEDLCGMSPKTPSATRQFLQRFRQRRCSF